MSDKERQVRVVMHLDPETVEMIKARLSDPKDEGVYDKGADGSELTTVHQKVVRFAEMVINGPALKSWRAATKATVAQADLKAELLAIKEANERAEVDQKCRDERLREIQSGPDS